VLKGQEANLEQMVALGFTIDDVFTAWALLYSFTIGFCIEEQAVTQSLDQGDDRYTLETRNKRLDDGEHPLVIEGGAQIFGDQDARFDRMVAILVDAADRLRTHRV
jgi:TetR/AcrR family tetracycline transcriptional repressor